jgi:hypothetical protein
MESSRSAKDEAITFMIGARRNNLTLRGLSMLTWKKRVCLKASPNPRDGGKKKIAKRKRLQMRREMDILHKDHRHS